MFWNFILKIFFESLDLKLGILEFSKVKKKKAF